MENDDIDISYIMGFYSRIKRKNITNTKPLVWIPDSLYSELLKEVENGNK